MFWESGGIMALLPAVGDRGVVKTATKLSRIQNELVRLESFAMSDADHSNSISLRSASDEDSAFLLELYKSSRGDDLRSLGWEKHRISEFLDMQYEAQQRFHANEYKRPTDQVVLRGGEPIGHLFFERRDHEIRCVDIALLPPYRNSGVGTYLIRQLQAEAKREGKPLRLQVIRFNRAVALFERLGFVRVSETGTHFQMEWTPD
jgi:GNAT superfamily N-acetyltransferase